MRIYEGSPRQDFEEVFRSIGAFLDQRRMAEVLLVEAPDGFIVQGMVVSNSSSGTWSDTIGTQTKETLTFLDDDIARFMDESIARRGQPAPGPERDAGHYENAFRVLGRYMDEQKPHDVFFFEQEGAEGWVGLGWAFGVGVVVAIAGFLLAGRIGGPVPHRADDRMSDAMETARRTVDGAAPSNHG
jgi:hypothetical protein